MPSLDQTAAAIADGLTSGWADGDLVRLLAQAVTEFDACDDASARSRFLDRPRPTGSPTWDAALAALAIHLCRRAGFDTTPPWTREADRFAPRLTWLGLPDNSTLFAYVFQRTPAYFTARGVLLNAENLESV